MLLPTNYLKKNARIPIHELPSITDFGYMFNEDDKLEHILSTQPMAPLNC